MSGLALDSIKARSRLSFNDANKHEGTNTAYAGVVNYLLSRYTTDAVVAKNIKKIET